MIAHYAVWTLITIELIIVSIVDLKSKKIHNYWSVFNILLFLFVFFIQKENYPNLGEHFFFPVVFFIIGFMLYFLKIMGAGDVKIIFTILFLIPTVGHQSFLELLSIVTITMGLILILIVIFKNLKYIVHSIHQKDFKSIMILFGNKFSYAPVIFLSWIWFLWKMIGI